jgi:hypothetical protein
MLEKLLWHGPDRFSLQYQESRRLPHIPSPLAETSVLYGADECWKTHRFLRLSSAATLANATIQRKTDQRISVLLRPQPEELPDVHYSAFARASETHPISGSGDSAAGQTFKVCDVLGFLGRYPPLSFSLSEVCDARKFAPISSRNKPRSR